MGKSSGLRGKELLFIFFVLLIVTRSWLCVAEFAKQGVLPGLESAVFGAVEIYLAYLLKNRREWPLWIFRAIGFMHMFSLIMRIFLIPTSIYLIVTDIFYIVSIIILNIFISDIRCYFDGED